jgi:peptidylprolyl isomerase
VPQQQSKRERQKERRAAQRAAVLAARKRRARRRLLARVVLLLILAGGIVAAVLSLLGDDEEDVATQDTTTSTTAAPPMESAAGKPCVPVADPLPIGAPAVPVKVGPPPTELVKEDLKVGTGPAVAQGATITVNYIGVACSTGRIFDSSFARGQPATLPLTGVIAGWQEGIPGMNVGGQRLLVIPPHKGYGQNGRPPSIAPGETLWFVVEVVSVA